MTRRPCSQAGTGARDPGGGLARANLWRDMELFFELRAAIADWLALTRPDTPRANFFVMVGELQPPVTLVFTPASIRPADPAAVRRRCLDAMQAFVLAAYPDADFYAVMVCPAGGPNSDLTVRGRTDEAQEVEESHQAGDFNTTDRWPVGPDGRLGLRRTCREDPQSARACRRAARRYARERDSDQEE